MTAWLRVDPVTKIALNWEEIPDGEAPADCREAALAATIFPASNGAQPGWTYSNGTWTAPQPLPSMLQTPTVFAPRDFIALFTPAEQQAIFTAAQSNWEVFMFVSLVTAGTVDVTNPTVQADIGALVAAGLLTQARATAVLAGQVPEAGGS